MTATSTSILVPLSEETVSRLMGKRCEPSECLSDIIDRLTASNDSQSRRIESDRYEPGSGRTRYTVLVLGEILPVSTLVEALAKVLNMLADLDPEFLERLERTGGRTRRNVARGPHAIYPGRPDLSRYALEFRPGWWIGTNYSRRDICRIVEDACRVTGLAYGRDVELVDT